MGIYLRAFEVDDYKLINKWREDEEIQSLLGGSKYYVSSEREKKWVEEKIFNNANQIYWAICLKNNNKMIGYISVRDFDWINKKVKWHGLIIGDKKYRNIKNSLDAIYLMLDHIFNQLGMHRIYGYYMKENEKSILLGKMMGFKIEGTMREAIYKNGKYHDFIIAALLKNEFKELKFKKTK